jgi:hypothetical protein
MKLKRNTYVMVKAGSTIVVDQHSIFTDKEIGVFRTDEPVTIVLDKDTIVGLADDVNL